MKGNTPRIFPKAHLSATRKTFNNGQPLLDYRKLFDGHEWKLTKRSLGNRIPRHVVVTIWKASKRHKVRIKTKVRGNELFVQKVA